MGSVVDSLEISFSPSVILPTFVLLGQTLRALRGDTSEKFDLSLPVFQGQLKVIGTDSDRSATYDFLLTFHGNHGSDWYRSRDKWQLGRKLQFSPTRALNAPDDLCAGSMRRLRQQCVYVSSLDVYACF